MNKANSGTVAIGDVIGPIFRDPTTVDIYRFTAVTGNQHRIHYDLPYAQFEGYPGIIVNGHLHGAYLTALCTDWLPETGSLRSIDLHVKRFAIAGDHLTLEGRVTEVRQEDGTTVVTADIEERKEDGTVCASGSAVFELR